MKTISYLFTLLGTEIFDYSLGYDQFLIGQMLIVGLAGCCVPHDGEAREGAGGNCLITPTFLVIAP